MPATSKKQYRFMQMMAHNPPTNKIGVGPSKKVAEEFVKKTPKKNRIKWSSK